MRYSFIHATVSLLCAGALMGCPDSEAEYPEGGAGAAAPQGGYGAQTPYQQGGYGAQTPAPQGGAGAAAPAPTTTATAPPASTATPVPPAMAAMASPLIKELARKETNGMREEGPAMAANFQQGQIFEQPFQIQPGRCYAVVGVGMGITELDFEIVVHQPPAPEWIAAKDSTTGPQAVLGGNGNCFKNPLPVGAPAKLRIRATGGSGIALAQIYAR